MSENTVPSTAETVSETPVPQSKLRRYGKIAAITSASIAVAVALGWAIMGRDEYFNEQDETDTTE